MKKLVYFSPVHWSSPKQRSHAFVEWFHSRTGLAVVWIEPQLLRYPKLSDIAKLSTHFKKVELATPNWLQVESPTFLPIEPNKLLLSLMGRTWHKFLEKSIGNGEDFVLVIGLPSKLALYTLNLRWEKYSHYDAMDDFPQFHSGRTRRSISITESQILDKVDGSTCTSLALEIKMKNLGHQAELVPNGSKRIDAKPRIRTKSPTETLRVCYLGTVGPWFDWKFLIGFAEDCDQIRISIIGPIYNRPSRKLPRNISILGQMPHDAAIKKLSEFDVGLIPFKINTLTASVDPVKLYEYLDAGLLVLSSRFGGMNQHQTNPNICFYEPQNNNQALLKHLRKKLAIETTDYQPIQHGWDERFNSSQKFTALLET